MSPKPPANEASKPTPPNATCVGPREEGEDVQAPKRVFPCPGCGVQYVIEPHEDVLEGTQLKAGTTLHFDFECSECEYQAAMGLS